MPGEKLLLSRNWRASSSVSTGVKPLDDVLRPPRSMGRIDGDDPAGDEPVEQHAKGGEVLLDGRLFEISSQRLDICGDAQRLDRHEFAEAAGVAPAEENRLAAVSPGVAIRTGMTGRLSASIDTHPRLFCCTYWRRRARQRGQTNISNFPNSSA